MEVHGPKHGQVLDAQANRAQFDRLAGLPRDKQDLIEEALLPVPAAHAADQVASGEFTAMNQAGDTALRGPQARGQLGAVEQTLLLVPQLLRKARDEDAGMPELSCG